MSANVISDTGPFVAQEAQATNTQGAAGMVVINPGGGALADGSDGIMGVFNATTSLPGPSFDPTRHWVATEGSDQQFFAGTGQWNATGTSPLLSLSNGGSPILIGEAGAARVTPNLGLAWTRVSLVSRSGAVGVAPVGTGELDDSTSTGDAAVLLRYEWYSSSLDDTYIVDREVSYTYPNNFYTENYTFTIPTGSTDVKFYQGGDASPGDATIGAGSTVASPLRTVYSVNQTSGIYVAYGAVDDTTFDAWYAGEYISVYPDIQQGNDLPATPYAGSDVGIDVQWTLGSTPGTYTRSMRTIVNFSQVNLTASVADDSIMSDDSTLLTFEAVNLLSEDESVAFSYELPTGLSIAGSVTNTCGGTVTGSSDDTSIEIVDGNVPAVTNCQVVVPVGGATGSYTVAEQDIAATAPLVPGFQESTLLVVGPPSITTGSLPAGRPNVAYSQTLSSTGGVAPLTWAITSGSLPAGLSLNASTGEISGTPTATGTSTFTVTLTDSDLQTDTKALSITISSPPDPGPAPAPVFPPSAPQSVFVTPGDGAATVVWSAPSSSGSSALTQYEVASSPESDGCTTPAIIVTCRITGLTNGTEYTFTVRASNSSGFGPFSAPSASVIPDENPKPTPPDPRPIPAPVPAGQVTAEEDGEAVPAEVEPNPDEDGVIITGDSFTMAIDALDAAGKPLDLDPDGVVVTQRDGQVFARGTGFDPGTAIGVYLDPAVAPERQDDSTLLVGTLLVDLTGEFAGTMMLPEGTEPGDHVLQAVGFTTNGFNRSVNLGIRIVEDRSMLITGTRGKVRGRNGVLVTGTSEGLVGETIQARVKLAGQVVYNPGSKRVIDDEGNFTWQRITGKKVYVYFRGEGVRSNRIILRADR